jgi:hypothetical protein
VFWPLECARSHRLTSHTFHVLVVSLPASAPNSIGSPELNLKGGTAAAKGVVALVDRVVGQLIP